MDLNPLLIGVLCIKLRQFALVYMDWWWQRSRLGSDNVPSPRWTLQMVGLQRRPGIVAGLAVPLVLGIMLAKHRRWVTGLDRQHGYLGLDGEQHRPGHGVQVKLGDSSLRYVSHWNVVLKDVTVFVTDVIVHKWRSDVAGLHGSLWRSGGLQPLGGYHRSCPRHHLVHNDGAAVGTLSQAQGNVDRHSFGQQLSMLLAPTPGITIPI